MNSISYNSLITDIHTYIHTHTDGLTHTTRTHAKESIVINMKMKSTRVIFTHVVFLLW
jgi:hypothetical protein